MRLCLLRKLWVGLGRLVTIPCPPIFFRLFVFFFSLVSGIHPVSVISTYNYVSISAAASRQHRADDRDFLGQQVVFGRGLPSRDPQAGFLLFLESKRVLGGPGVSSASIHRASPASPPTTSVLDTNSVPSSPSRKKTVAMSSPAQGRPSVAMENVKEKKGLRKLVSRMGIVLRRTRKRTGQAAPLTVPEEPVAATSGFA